MTETAKLTATDAVKGDGETILHLPAPDAALPEATATQTAKLTASNGAARDFLGDSVAVSGDTIVAGAPGATVNGHARQGAAYVFPCRG